MRRIVCPIERVCLTAIGVPELGCAVSNQDLHTGGQRFGLRKEHLDMNARVVLAYDKEAG